MWPKNLQLYRLPTPWAIDLAALEEQISRGPFVKCSANQPTSRGWISPRKDGPLVYAINRQWLIALKVEERLLPSSVVNDEVKERAEALTESHGYAPGRKELRELKERVIEELMPRAFTKSHATFVWLDPVNGWFVVDASSPTKAEAVIEHLRACLDEFPLMPLHTQLSPSSAMAGWLAGGDAPAGFTIDRDCELKSVSEDKSAVAYKRQALGGEVGDEVKAHLSAGKLPIKLALTWDDRISFVLTERLEIKRLAFLDILKEEAEKSAEHADEQFDADFALWTGELSRFIPALVQTLGGIVIDLAEQGGGAPVAAAIKKLDDLAREDGGTISVEHQGETIGTFGDGPDPLFDEAVSIVRANQRASISLVQRQLRIGYNRAARLIEAMEVAGIVSTMDAQGARSILEA